MKLQALMTVLLLGSTGCAHVALDDTYGINFNAVFGAQLADRQAKDTPLRGEECRRIMTGYYESIAPEGSGGAAGGGAAASQAANRGSSPAPTPFCIGAH